MISEGTVVKKSYQGGSSENRRHRFSCKRTYDGDSRSNRREKKFRREKGKPSYHGGFSENRCNRVSRKRTYDGGSYYYSSSSENRRNRVSCKRIYDGGSLRNHRGKSPPWRFLCEPPSQGSLVREPKMVIHQGTALVCLYHGSFFENRHTKFEAIGQIMIWFRFFTVLENHRECPRPFTVLV